MASETRAGWNYAESRARAVSGKRIIGMGKGESKKLTNERDDQEIGNVCSSSLWLMRVGWGRGGPGQASVEEGKKQCTSMWATQTQKGGGSAIWRGRHGGTDGGEGRVKEEEKEMSEESDGKEWRAKG